MDTGQSVNVHSADVAMESDSPRDANDKIIETNATVFSEMLRTKSDQRPTNYGTIFEINFTH